MGKNEIVTRGRTLDYAAGVYDLLSPLMTFGQEKKYSLEAMNLLDFNKISRVLDIGCGTGTLTIKIAEELLNKKDSLVVGLDAAPKMIDVALKKAKKINNIRFDVEAAEVLPYEDESFDAVVSTFFFHHIDFELKQKTILEAYRVLKKKGVLVVVDVDAPTTLFGKLCAWSGYFLFSQPEIKENIDGKLEEVFKRSPFLRCQKISHHLGYISIFKLEK